MTRLVFGHDRVVTEWAEKRMGREFADPKLAIGIINSNGLLVGAAFYQRFNGSDIEISLYGPQCLRLNVVRDLMHYAFNVLGANRITARTPKTNEAMRRSIGKLGFKFEGAMRCYYGPYKRHTAYVFGLLKRDAERYIGKQSHVDIQSAQAA